MVFTSKLYMLEPSTMSSHFSLVLSLLGMNIPATPFRLQIWQCSNRTLSLLIISCPGNTNHYLTPCFYPSLLLTLLSFSFSSPFITNNPCSFLHSRTQPISISLDFFFDFFKFFFNFFFKGTIAYKQFWQIYLY